MKLKKLIYSTLGVMALTTQAWASEVNVMRAAQTNNAFGWSLFKNVQRNAVLTENTLFSPVSAWLALSLASQGAEGQTFTEMQKVLSQSGWTRAQGGEAARLLVQDLLNGTETEETLRIADAVWANSDQFALSQEFVATAETYYRIRPDDAIARSESFSQPQTLQHINDWVSESTQGMIPNIVDRLDRDMAAILLNALFFQGQWYQPFGTRMTSAATFHKADGTRTQVQMMREDQKHFLYAQSGEFKMVSLGFRAGKDADDIPVEGRFYVDLILPTQDGGNLAKLNEAHYQSLLAKARPSLVELAVPKFKFSYENKLNDELQVAGMVQAFDPRTANFVRLGRSQGASHVFISQVLQKTAVEMDESGFKAAAVTGIMMNLTSLPPKPSLHFIANQPFFLALRDSRTGAVLFQGIIANPQN